MATQTKPGSEAEVLQMLASTAWKAKPSGKRSINWADRTRAAIRKGLPYSAFATLVERLDVPSSELARVLCISDRTLARRKLTKHFTPDESDRVFRLGRAFLMARSILESEAAAAGWLKRPNRALGLEVPLKLLDTDGGARQVEGILNRIRYGIYS